MSSMSSEARSLSLPSLHNIRRQRAKTSTRSTGGSSSCRLPSSPSTPSTAASSRNAPSSNASFRSTASSGISWDANEEWMQHHAGETRSSTHSTLCLSLPNWQFNSEFMSRDIRLPSAVVQAPRPDEELLESVRTDVVFGDGDSVESIYDLIRSGEDINQRSVRGLTPLAVAAAAGSEPLVSLLLEKNADVTLTSTDRQESPLHYAAFLGDHVICHLLLQAAAAVNMVNVGSSVGSTPLHLAVVAGHVKSVHTLLRAKGIPDKSNAVLGDQNALHLAALSGHAEVLELLLEHDGNANLHDSLKRTPLHMAAARADATCVALLLRYRADPMLRGGNRNTLASELVPRDHAGTKAARTRQLLSAYVRQAPAPLRTDDRFDLPGGHDILSAYKYPVPWGLNNTRRLLRTTDSRTCHEWKEDDEDAVWL